MADNKESPFLKLPAELRNRIYEEALIRTKTVHLTTLEAKPSWRCPDLLHTCQQLRSEASTIYYSGNTFRVLALKETNSYEDSEKSCSLALVRWLHAMDRADRMLLRKVYLDDRYYKDTQIAEDSIKTYQAAVTKEGLELDGSVLFVEVDQYMGCSDVGSRRWFAIDGPSGPGSERDDDGNPHD